MKRRFVFEKHGDKLFVNCLVLFVYTTPGAVNPQVSFSIDLYDNIKKKTSVSISADLPNVGYNCIRIPMEPQIVATHCYLTVQKSPGVYRFESLFAIGGIGIPT